MFRKTFLLAFIGSFFVTGVAQAKDPSALIERMVRKSGTLKKLYSKKDVEYTYIYRDNKSGKEDVSLERYIFDGELSWASYKKHEKHVFPDQEGEVIQGYDGSKTWVTLNGQPVTDPQAVKLSDFLRKTNFYWFAMMFKLQDPGVNHTYKGTRSVDGIDYDLVGVSFDQGVGDASDEYLLYINPQTHLVDQFLFTVMDFGLKEPLLMKVEYEKVGGLLLPAKRKYIESDWTGAIKGDSWIDEIMTNIRFKNGFSRSLFFQ